MIELKIAWYNPYATGNWFSQWLSRSIARKCGGRFSHVTIFIPDRGWFSAHPDGGTSYQASEVAADDPSWTVLPAVVDDVDLPALQAWADQQVQRRPVYSWWNAIRCWNVFMWLPRDPFGMGMCSQTVDGLLDQARYPVLINGRPFTDMVRPEDCNPNELYQEATGSWPYVDGDRERT